mmetsp:Transcript_20703/g.45212  ORF Transcript_20703/g.45212 Transcript_20703/m.45212 type:complete len:530 (-) Transcript_20703:93-1682(-)|eukprot:CAMPEP_0203748574 /NCGR_PEP_ID=MMETSP0098-20131031/3421_1 /ASSEMBLY_ACC=CAM_ASM_000208 /TAXON_ID=96639 /ORGANISM=" , Strain NY0313808BC1" /LENGTH=529 /DNA_ID=CAMNT_0050637355 /DNA_START=2512 /DNA_END=4098 /DNA_ORIENTATION=-
MFARHGRAIGVGSLHAIGAVVCYYELRGSKMIVGDGESWAKNGPGFRGGLANGDESWWGTGGMDRFRSRVHCDSLDGAGAVRMRTFGNYENKLRKYAPLEKRFAYFASIPASMIGGNADDRNTMYMTPEDFVRSLLPFVQGSSDAVLGSANFRFNLGRNTAIGDDFANTYKNLCKTIVQDEKKLSKTRKGSSERSEIKAQIRCNRRNLRALRRQQVVPYEVHLKFLEEIGVTNADLYRNDPFVELVDADGDGIITFEEYVLFVSLLGIPREDLRLVFKIIDSSGDGVLDRSEFAQALAWIVAQGGNQAVFDITGDQHAHIVEKLFKTKEQISFQDLDYFLIKLHANVSSLEFETFDRGNKGFLKPSEFAVFIRSIEEEATPESAKRFSKMISELEKEERSLSESDLASQGVTPEEFVKFNSFLSLSHNFKVAVKLFDSVDIKPGFSLNNLESLFAIVAPCERHQVSPRIARLLFKILGGDSNNRIPQDELLRLAKSRKSTRNLYGNEFQNNKDRGLVKTLRRFYSCVKS